MEPPRVNEMKTLIKSLNLHKSVGHDNISSYYLRIALDILAPVLCYFIDNAFRLKVFQQSCKKAKIITAFKTGKPNAIIFQTYFYIIDKIP